MTDTTTLPWAESVPEPWRKVGAGPGWDALIRRLDADLRVMDPGYTVIQVKEKFGELRFYTEHGLLRGDLDDQFYARIREAELESARTCEECGEPGETRSSRGGWLRTLCDTCEAERVEARGGA